MAIESSGGPEEHFDPALFDGELEAHGTPARWRKARLCPCLNPTTGAPDPNCRFCAGYPGVVWDDAGELRVLAFARRRQDLYDQNGHLLKGVVTLTFPSTVVPSHLDQIELTAAVIVVNTEKHVRGQVDPSERSTERLRMPSVLAIEFCEAIVAGDLVRYVEGTDFLRTDSNGLIWAPSGPPADTLYTVRYTARPTYICWSPESRDENGGRQPYRCMAQRLDFFNQPVIDG